MNETLNTSFQIYFTWIYYKQIRDEILKKYTNKIREKRRYGLRISSFLRRRTFWPSFLKRWSRGELWSHRNDDEDEIESVSVGDEWMDDSRRGHYYID